MPSKNIFVPYMSLAPHIIHTKKYIYMSLSGTQGMSIKFNGIPVIFPNIYAIHLKKHTRDCVYTRSNIPVAFKRKKNCFLDSVLLFGR